MTRFLNVSVLEVEVEVPRFDGRSGGGTPTAEGEKVEVKC